MTRVRLISALSVAAAGLAIFVAGTEPLGRLLLTLGLPGIALPLLEGPGERGRALDGAGRHGEAADLFADAGEPYNEGVSAARAGDYARALAAWEKVLAADPGDRDARDNYDLVASILSGVELQPFAPPDERDPDGAEALAEIGQGVGRASSTGDEATNEASAVWMPEITSAGARRVPRYFDSQFIRASEDWLATMPDQPGQYLAARLAAEQERRIFTGVALPPAEDPR